MDPIMVAVLLSWVEVKSVCEMLVKHPDNDDELAVAEHVLMVMDRYMREAKPGSRTPARAIRLREDG
jgi:hypothetical protein